MSAARRYTGILGPQRVGPPMGTKQVFLPNFVITLLRTPKSPPTMASFIVPLKLNKLDLRDYLWNGYGVHVNKVRSYIQISKIRQDKPGSKRPSPRKWHRPASIKKMMIEMDKPFVWPEEPTDFEPWDKKTHDAALQNRTKEEESFRPSQRQQPSKDRQNFSSQAKAILRTQKNETAKGENERQKSLAEDEWEEVDQDEELPMKR